MKDKLKKIDTAIKRMLPQLGLNTKEQQAVIRHLDFSLCQFDINLPKRSEEEIVRYLIGKNPRLNFDQKRKIIEKTISQLLRQRKHLELVIIFTLFTISLVWKFFYVKKNDFSVLHITDFLFLVFLCKYEFQLDLETISNFSLKKCIDKLKSCTGKIKFSLNVPDWQYFMTLGFSIVKNRNYIFQGLLIFSNLIIPHVAFIECDLKFNIVPKGYISVNTMPRMTIKFENSSVPKDHTIIKEFTAPGDSITPSVTILKRFLSKPDIIIKSVQDEFDTSYKYDISSINNYTESDKELWMVKLLISAE